MPLNTAKRLIKYGFIRSEFNYPGNKREDNVKYKKLASELKELNPADREAKLENMPDKDAEQISDIEYAEEYYETIMSTDYPQPVKRFWLAFESANLSLEEFYYWFHHELSTEIGYQVEKIIDTYAASEASSFFGMMQQRLSIQQGNISNFLKGISEMIKGLFQIVREIRILNDRMQYYDDTYKKNENADSSEIVLKGLWVDQVEGGTKNPSSIYGLAQNVGFTILPDLFFRVRMDSKKDVDKKVDELQFNDKVKEMLKRKLRQYYEWKERTYKELETRKKFELKYLKQHYETINLYVSWIKPYLRYTKRMKQRESLEEDARLIKSFEGAFIEIEILAKKKHGDAFSVMLLNFQYRTRPETQIHQPHDYSQKGPIHIGRAELKIRVYGWTKKEIENYIKFKKEEDIELLSAIDESIKEAMDSLGNELKSYLGIEGEKFGDEKKVQMLAQNLLANNIVSSIDQGVIKAQSMIAEKNKKSKLGGASEPFVAIFKGFEEIFGAFGLKDIKFSNEHKKHEDFELENSKKKALAEGKSLAYFIYKNYKKAHKMLSWS